jgi:ABC-type Fe3+-hydroxamate transport system substrate-binding protein
MGQMVHQRTFTDALGRTLTIPEPPGRIVSLVPSLTEALFAFGLAERVAGVTRFCVEPAEEVASKTKVGGTKNVDVASAVALQPDLVLANVEENTKEDVEALESAGLQVFLTFARTVSEAIEELQTIAAITDSEDAARPYVEDAHAALSEVQASEGAVRTFCPIWRNPWMTVGPDTYIHDVLTVCGAANVFSDASERYPEVRLPDVATRQPELVLLPDEPYRFGEKNVPEVIDALPGVRIELVDGKMLCWYGPRIGPSLRKLQLVIHGETGV